MKKRNSKLKTAFTLGTVVAFAIAWISPISNMAVLAVIAAALGTNVLVWKECF